MRDWVTFPDGARGQLSWAAHPDRRTSWQLRLSRAHGDDRRPHCDCRGLLGQNLELAVRRRHRQENGTTRLAYHLARLPGQGPLHAVTCPFHETDLRHSGRSAYQAQVIRDLPDGTIGVTLKQGLRIREIAHGSADQEQALASRCGGGRNTQTRMSQLGLLHLLWERAGLNAWSPADGKRNHWNSVRGRIDRTAGGINLGNTLLSERLVSIAYGDEDLPARLRATTLQCGDDWRIILVGCLDSITFLDAQPAVDGRPAKRARVSVMLGGSQAVSLHVGAEPVWWERLRRSHAWAMSELGRPRKDRTVRVVALVTGRVLPARGGADRSVFVWADDIALMEVGPGLVPVASGHELGVLAALAEQGRSFLKPLRFDASRDVVHPDFILRDTVAMHGTPMEVFGRTDEAYAARVEEKRRYYNETFGVENWWSWDATRGPSWPDFPDRYARP